MISVVMPAHNAEQYIGEAIESILNQTHSNFEFIIVDDSSTDTTWSIIQSYANKDSRIKPYQAQVKNAGLARNYGVELCQCDYIAFMDSDDIAYKTRLEKQLAYMIENPNVVVLGSYLQMITSDGHKMGILKNGPTTSEEFHKLDRTKKLISLYGANTMIRRDVFNQVGGFLSEGPIKEIHGTEDGELWDRMAEYGECLALPEVLIDYRQHTESLSTVNVSNKHKAHRFIHMRHEMRLQGKTLTLDEFLEYYHNLSPLKHFGIAMRTKSEQLIKNGKIYKARQQFIPMVICYLKAIAYHPMRFINRLLFGTDPSIWRI
ncbi:MAG: glycosyltransferase family 2 protein [Anaerolineae bacterium]